MCREKNKTQLLMFYLLHMSMNATCIFRQIIDQLPVKSHYKTNGSQHLVDINNPMVLIGQSIKVNLDASVAAINMDKSIKSA